MAHGCHDAVSACVEGALDHPLLTPGDADDRACPFGSDGVVELVVELVYRNNMRLETGTYLIVIRVRDQSVLGIDEDPAEPVSGGCGRPVQNSFGNGGAGEPVRKEPELAES
jgi:hypothetical protein